MLRTRHLLVFALLGTLVACERREVELFPANIGASSDGGLAPGAGDGSDDGSDGSDGGGGGGDGEDDPGDGEPGDGFGAVQFCIDGSETPPDAEGVLLFTGGLQLVDPRDPATVVVVREEDVQVNRTAWLSTVDFVPGAGVKSSPSLANVRSSQVVYSIGSQLFRVATQLAPSEVAEETDLDIDLGVTVVAVRAGEDYADACRTQIVVELEGGVHKTVLSDGSGRDFPAPPVDSFVDPSTGRLQGWLAHEPGGAASWVDVEGEVTELTTADSIEVLAHSTAAGAYLDVDGAVHFLRTASGELEDLGVDLTRFGSYAVTGDVDDLLLLAAQGSQITIDRVRSNGDTERIFEALDGDGFFQNLQLGVTGDHVAFTYNVFFSTRLYTIPADGSGPALFIDQGVNSLVTTEARVYYTTLDFTNTFRAIAVRGDGTEDFREPSAKWVGFQYEEVRLGPAAPTRVFLVRGIDPMTFSAAGGDLLVLEPETLTETVNLGEIDDDVRSFQIRPAFVDTVLVRASVFDGEFVTDDVYFFDAAAPGSLRRLTSTPDVSEAPIAPLLF